MRVVTILQISAIPCGELFQRFEELFPGLTVDLAQLSKFLPEWGDESYTLFDPTTVISALEKCYKGDKDFYYNDYEGNMQTLEDEFQMSILMQEA